MFVRVHLTSNIRLRSIASADGSPGRSRSTRGPARARRSPCGSRGQLPERPPVQLLPLFSVLLARRALEDPAPSRMCAAGVGSLVLTLAGDTGRLPGMEKRIRGTALTTKIRCHVE